MELYPSPFVNETRKHTSRFGAPRVVNFVTSESPEIRAYLARFQEWFSHIPVEHQNELVGRLRSTDDRQFLGAYFEVVFHEFLLQRGYNLTIHPHIDQTSGRPDFLASKDNAFYLEVKTRLSSSEIAEKEDEINRFLCMIDSIQSPYLIVVQFLTWLPTGFDAKRARKALEDYLNSLSSQHIDEIKMYHYREQGALIDYAIQRKPRTTELPTLANRGLPPMFSWGSDLIRRALFEKIKKHRGIEGMSIPYVIALCSSGDWMISEKALDWAVFGKQVFTFFPGHPERKPEWHRDPSGLFTPTPGDPSGRNTRVSAVIFCEQRWVGDKESYGYRMKVYHNAWAASPLPVEVFKGSPQFIKTSKTETEIRMDWIDDGDQVVLLQ